MPMNFARTGLLLVVLTAIFVSMGWAVAGGLGMIVAFFVAVITNAIGLWKSDSLVLRMHKAQEVDARSAPEFHGLIRDLAQRAELPMPRTYIVHSPQPNAFATGRNPANSAVCASTGLLEMLSREEVAGVMAHELAHIRSRDTLTMTMAATIGGAISMLAQMLQFSMIFGGRDRRVGFLATLVAAVVAPFAAMLVQMAISRSREYQADRLGAMICGNPLWLASALQRIQEAVRGIPNEQAEAIPATAHLFIINPLTGRGIDSFFSTHPKTENRIAELLALAREWGIPTNEADQIREDRQPRPSAASPQHRRGPWG